LYDIVTATDAAGNPTKRSNFEWFYTLSIEHKSQEIPITVRKVYLSEAAALVLHPRQQAALGQWVSAPELDSMPIR